MPTTTQYPKKKKIIGVPICPYVLKLSLNFVHTILWKETQICIFCYTFRVPLSCSPLNIVSSGVIVDTGYEEKQLIIYETVELHLPLFNRTASRNMT